MKKPKPITGTATLTVTSKDGDVKIKFTFDPVLSHDEIPPASHSLMVKAVLPAVTDYLEKNKA